MMEKAVYFRVDLHTKDEMPALGRINNENITTTGAYVSAVVPDLIFLYLDKGFESVGVTQVGQ